MIIMKATFTDKDGVEYVIESSGSSGDPFRDARDFKIAVTFVVQESEPKTLLSKSESMK